jgi:hypothetical protein
MEGLPVNSTQGSYMILKNGKAIGVGAKSDIGKRTEYSLLVKGKDSGLRGIGKDEPIRFGKGWPV